jgi:hypothetical protein
MADKPTTEITLGYGGGAYININGGKAEEDFCWVFMNSGSITKNLNVPNFLAYNMELDFNDNIPNVRNDVALGCGLVSFQGSLNFAITQSSLDKLFNKIFINRNNVFDIGINDGRKVLELKCCYWNSFSISGNPRQVLTGSLNFVSTNNQLNDFDIYEANEVSNKAYHMGFNEKLIEYWNTGAKGIETFNLNFTKETTPVYLNTKSNTPSYIRVGKLGLTGQFSSWKNWFNTKEIYISNKVLSFQGESVRDSAGFSFQGIDNTGMHNYSLKLYNLSNSAEFSWDIENLPRPQKQ